MAIFRTGVDFKGGPGDSLGVSIVWPLIIKSRGSSGGPLGSCWCEGGPRGAFPRERTWEMLEVAS